MNTIQAQPPVAVGMRPGNQAVGGPLMGTVMPQMMVSPPTSVGNMTIPLQPNMVNWPPNGLLGHGGMPGPIPGSAVSSGPSTPRGGATFVRDFLPSMGSLYYTPTASGANTPIRQQPPLVGQMGQMSLGVPTGVPGMVPFVMTPLALTPAGGTPMNLTPLSSTHTTPVGTPKQSPKRPNPPVITMAPVNLESATPAAAAGAPPKESPTKRRSCVVEKGEHTGIITPAGTPPPPSKSLRKTAARSPMGSPRFGPNAPVSGITMDESLIAIDEEHDEIPVLEMGLTPQLAAQQQQQQQPQIAKVSVIPEQHNKPRQPPPPPRYNNAPQPQIARPVSMAAPRVIRQAPVAPPIQQQYFAPHPPPTQYMYPQPQPHPMGHPYFSYYPPAPAPPPNNPAVMAAAAAQQQQQEQIRRMMGVVVNPTQHHHPMMPAPSLPTEDEREMPKKNNIEQAIEKLNHAMSRSLSDETAYNPRQFRQAPPPPMYPSSAAVHRQQDSKIDRVRREYHNQALAAEWKSGATDSVSHLRSLQQEMHARCGVGLNLRPRHAKFFVIKSFGEDDVHKAIKYNVWCSTEKGNTKLNDAWHSRCNFMADGDVAEEDYPIYLFYSVNRSGRFCGVAKLESGYDKSSNETIWMEDGKWNGKFNVSWFLVKDVPNSHLKHICLPNNDNKPVTYSRDTQEIPYEQGLTVLQTFVNYPSTQSLLDNYLYYDKREDAMQMSKQDTPSMSRSRSSYERGHSSRSYGSRSYHPRGPSPNSYSQSHSQRSMRRFSHDDAYNDFERRSSSNSSSSNSRDHRRGRGNGHHGGYRRGKGFY